MILVIQVVSFGVGTKFMPQSAILKDHAGVGVRDCHAEVLARRAFTQFLHLQMQSFQFQNRTCCVETCASASLACGVAGRGQGVQGAAAEASEAAEPLQVRPKYCHAELSK